MTRRHGRSRATADYGTADVGLTRKDRAAMEGGLNPDGGETPCGCCGEPVTITPDEIVFKCGCRDAKRCGKCGRCDEHCCTTGWKPVQARF